jgi:hypothetical protein
MAAAFTPYPMSIGAKRFSVAVHVGPAAYSQVTTGPLAGGDVLSAKELGLEWIEHIQAGFTSDGLFSVEPVNPTAVPAKSVILRWKVVSTGNQVAGAFNLSGSSVNLTAIGI